jgi:iron complex outermembrane receptor protein
MRLDANASPRAGSVYVRRAVRLALVRLAQAGAVCALSAGTVIAQDAENADAEDLALQEVVVTAQFRQERLQETPIAITAISGSELEARSVDDLSQLQNVAPNVSLDRTSSAFGPSVGAFIRGVGQGDFNYNFEPGVGIYVDDVYHATLMGSLFELVDLERVEVLRGPQGTLFGKNSIGGAIRLISRKPQGDGSAYIEGTYGEFNRQDLRGMFDMALVPDKLFMRFSAMSKKRDGYVKRLDYACVHPDLGASQGYAVNLSAPRLLRSSALEQGNCELGTEGGEDVQGARIAFRLLATDDLEINLSGDFVDDNSEASPTTLLATDDGIGPGNPDGTPARAAFNNLFLQTFGVQFDDRFVTGDPYTNYATFDDKLRNQTYPAVARMESYGTALTIDWRLNEAIRLKSITGYRGYSGDWSDDQEASPLPLAWVHQVVDHHAFSQELQFTGTTLGDKLDWATGLFYFDGFNLNRGHVNINVLPGVPIPGVSVPLQGGGTAVFPAAIDFSQDDPSNVKSKAAFVQTTYRFTDALSLTTGARYSTEDKDYTFDHVSPPFINLADVYKESGYNRWDWRASFDWQLTDTVLTYVSGSTGFKGGGLNPRPFNDAQVIPFGPETLRSYEVGLKSEWFDRRVRANLAVFRSDYEDLQQSSSTSDATGAPFVGPTNVGEQQLQGFELEVTARLVDSLLVDLGLGYTDAEYKDLGNAINCNAPGVVPIPIGPGIFSNCVNNGPLLSDDPGGPKWRGNLGVQYTFAFTNGSTLTPRIDAAFRDEPASIGNSNDFYTDDDIAGYTLYNGRITWTSADDDWSVALSGTNLADKRYWVNYFNLRNLDEFHMIGQPGRPREWAFTVRRNF